MSFSDELKTMESNYTEILRRNLATLEYAHAQMGHILEFVRCSEVVNNRHIDALNRSSAYITDEVSKVTTTIAILEATRHIKLLDKESRSEP